MSSAGSYGAGGGGGVGNVKFLTGNSGGPVGPDLVGNINVVGTGSISVSGNAGTNTLTIELSGAVADQYVTQSGTAVPVAGILNIDGMSPITTSATGDTVFIGSDGTVATLYECDNSTSAAPLSGVLNVTGGTSGAIFTGFGNTITESFNFLSMADTTSSTGAIVIGGDVVLNAGGGVAKANIFVGESAGNFTVTGTFNSSLGAGASTSLTTGGNNVAIGKNTLTQATTDSGNTGVGASSLLALRGSSTGNNTACGFASLFNLRTGDQNIALGFDSGVNYIGAESSNIVIGNQGTLGESNAIRIGTQGGALGEQNYCNIAGIYGSTVGGTNSAVFIDNTGKLGTVGGSGGGGVTSITGDLAGSVAITGALTITGGSSGATFGTTGTTITESFNFLAMADTTATTGYIQIGASKVFAAYGGVASNNIFVGKGAGNATLVGTGNTAVGQGALSSLSAVSNGSANVAVGQIALVSCTTGDDNVALGEGSLADLTTGSSNTACGQLALETLVTGSDNIALGQDAGSAYSGAESSNIVIGNAGTNGESNVIRIGTNGSGAAQQNACYVAGIYGETVGGTNSAVFIDNTGKLGTSGGSGGGVSSLNTLTGALTLTGGSSGAIFTNSGGNTITETFNFLVMANTTSTTGYLQIGTQKVLACWGGVANNNIFVGQGAGHTTVSGTDNDALGALALAGVTSGQFNIAIGSSSLQALTTSSSNVSVGLNSLGSLTTGAGNNTSVGFAALGNLTTGDNIIAIGSTAGDGYTGAESSNIAIGAQGTAAESNVIRIGTQGSGAGQQNTCFIAGITGVTVASSAAVLINTGTGQLGTISSSRRFKENISDMGGASRDIYKLRPVKFNYKGDYNQSYGLIAEDVEEVMPYLVSYDKEGLPVTVRYHDLPALLLNEIQSLKLKIDELEGKLNARVR